MPWKASSGMEERARFIFEYERDERTMSELCERYGVARETGYVWLRRYRERGLAGLVELNRAPQRHPNKKARPTPPYSEPLAHADGPNRVWCADFKGWFRTADGERIDPLTISDAHSRYLLRGQAVEKTDTARVQAIF